MERLFRDFNSDGIPGGDGWMYTHVPALAYTSALHNVLNVFSLFFWKVDGFGFPRPSRASVSLSFSPASYVFFFQPVLVVGICITPGRRALRAALCSPPEEDKEL